MAKAKLIPKTELIHYVLESGKTLGTNSKLIYHASQSSRKLVNKTEFIHYASQSGRTTELIDYALQLCSKTNIMRTLLYNLKKIIMKSL